MTKFTRGTREMQFIVGANKIIVGTNVPYAQGHLDGEERTFWFDNKEKKNLERRVEKPTKFDTERIYYRLETAARKRTPITIPLPVRDWSKLPSDAQARAQDIAKLIADDIMQVMKSIAAKAITSREYAKKRAISGGGLVGGDIVPIVKPDLPGVE